jgi:hypothetical protein
MIITVVARRPMGLKMIITTEYEIVFVYSEFR